MEINFKTRKLEKTFNSQEKLVRNFGSENARIIMRRMTVLAAAPCLADVSHQRPERRHALEGNRKGQYAVDLKHPYRLIFKPDHDPVPLSEDGAVDLYMVRVITILEVEDYHG